MQLRANIVSSLENLNKARHLLYDCYVKKLKWKIATDNPSGIKIKVIHGRLAIVDDYDDLSIWFSIIKDSHLVACARLCKEDSNGLLEIERYDTARKPLKPILNLKHELNVLELNREAISSYYAADKTVGLLLLKMIFNYCLGHHYAVLTTTNIKEWVGIYNDLGFPKLDSCRFKYCYLDPRPVDVYFAKSIDMRKMLHTMDNFIDNKERYHVEAFCFS